MEIGQRLRRRQRTPDRKDAFEQIHQMIRLFDKVPDGYLVLRRGGGVAWSRHQPSQSTLQYRGRWIPRQGEIIGRLAAARGFHEALPLSLLNQRGHRMAPRDAG